MVTACIDAPNKNTPGPLSADTEPPSSLSTVTLTMMHVEHATTAEVLDDETHAEAIVIVDKESMFGVSM